MYNHEYLKLYRIKCNKIHEKDDAIKWIESHSTPPSESIFDILSHQNKMDINNKIILSFPDEISKIDDKMEKILCASIIQRSWRSGAELRARTNKLLITVGVASIVAVVFIASFTTRFQS
ncbi:MAG: hypothetical protein CML47_06965 [Rhodobacteraceae bacterium]|nr:MAG: hypothetical protein CML47_06965 [Paracoccaceae bacterium]